MAQDAVLLLLVVDHILLLAGLTQPARTSSRNCAWYVIMDLKITPSGQTIVKPTALGPVANTDTKLLIYGLFQKGRVLAQDGDRDQTYGAYFDTRVDGLGIEQVLTAPRSPWQNPFVERIIGSIRRECLDHVIVLDERHLKRILRKYVDYYHSCRTHLSLEKDAPEPRRVESPAMGKVRAIPKVGGLHHYYTRHAAA